MGKVVPPTQPRIVGIGVGPLVEAGVVTA
jgi:hypothetical protein